MRVYKATADTFLSEIVADAVDVVAARQAAYELRFKAERFDSAVSRIHQKHDEAKMVVLDIVSSYLFPEVCRAVPRAHHLGCRTANAACRRAWESHAAPAGLASARPLAQVARSHCSLPRRARALQVERQHKHREAAADDHRFVNAADSAVEAALLSAAKRLDVDD